MSSFFKTKTKLKLAQSILFKRNPIYVQYYLTAKCNLACEQCNIIYANADVEEIDLEKIECVARNLSKIGVSIVLLTGGEPFVRKDLPQIVRAFSRQDIHVRIQTNGLATEDQLMACVEAGVQDVSISLDSLHSDVQDTVNGGFENSWHKAIQTISLVNKIFPKDAFAALGCVFAPRNFRYVPDIVRFASKIGWWVSLVPAHTTANDAPMGFRTYDSSLDFHPSQYAEAIQVLEEVKALKKQGLNVYDSLVFLDDIQTFIQKKPLAWRRRNDGVCDSPNLYFAILPNGHMAVCCDWRMKNAYPVYAPDFPDRFFRGPIYDEAQAIAKRCGGCLFGSFPEISISSRFLKPMIQRSLFFGKKDAKRTLVKASHEEMLATIETIRLMNPTLYRQATNREA